MITFTRDGLVIDHEGWSSANPSDAGIFVRFKGDVGVFLSRELIAHAADLIDFEAKRRSSHAKAKP